MLIFPFAKQITVGRSTADSHVDVDLSLEGPAWKISRRQVIKVSFTFLKQSWCSLLESPDN